MKRMKRFLGQGILLFCMCLALGCAVTAQAGSHESTDVAYAVEGGNIYFRPSTGEIVDCDKGVTKAVIPAKISGNSVTSIRREAFRSCSLTSVSIPNSVTIIGGNAFSFCTNLSSVTIPNSVTDIGDSAFLYCISLSSVAIGNGVTSIGDSAFYECKGLTSISVPDSVTSLGAGVFTLCSSLDSILVDPQNKYYCSQDGVVFSKDRKKLLVYPAGKHGAYTIPAGVTEVGEAAFLGSQLTRLKIPVSLAHVGLDAFLFCSGLTDVYYEGNQNQWRNIYIAPPEGKESGNHDLTNATIHYNSTGPASETYGDVTGDNDVTMADVVKLSRHVAGFVTLTDEEIKLGDVTGDDDITMADVVKVSRYVAGFVKNLTLPVS